MIFCPGKFYLDDVIQSPVLNFEESKTTPLNGTMYKVTICGEEFTFCVDNVSQLALNTEDYENYFEDYPSDKSKNHYIVVRGSTVTNSVLLGPCLLEGATVEDGVIVDTVIRCNVTQLIFENVTAIDSLIEESDVYPNAFIQDCEIRKSEIRVTGVERYAVTNSNIEHSKITVTGHTDLDECYIAGSTLNSRTGMTFYHASAYSLDLYLPGINVKNVLEFAQIKLDSLNSLYVYKDKAGNFQTAMNESTEEPFQYGTADFDEQLSEALRCYTTVNVEPCVVFVNESIASRIKLLDWIVDQKPVI